MVDAARCLFPIIDSSEFRVQSSEFRVCSALFSSNRLKYRAHRAQFEQGIGLNLQPADFITVASNLTMSWAEHDDDCDDDIDNDDDCDEDSTDQGSF